MRWVEDEDAERTIATVFVAALLCLVVLPAQGAGGCGKCSYNTVCGQYNNYCRILDIL